MYRIIIADDEKIIREGLIQLIDWRDFGFEIVATFEDGRDVIEYLDSMPVDVVLSDIMMPYFGGIDIARYVYETENPCKIVFISGHKEFNLALQAIKYGVQDYILKPSKVEDIKAVFGKIKKELDARQKDMEFLERAETRWLELQPILEEKFLSSLMLGTLDDKEDIRQRLQFLHPDIDAEKCSCALVDLEVKEYESFVADRWNYGSDQFDDAIYNFVRMFQGTGYFHVVYKYREKIRLFLIMREYRATKEENDKLCESQIREFTWQFVDIFGVNVSIEINRIFESVLQIVEWREDIVGNNIHWSDTERLLQERKRLILTNIIQGNIRSAQKIMKNILKSLSGDNIRYNRQFVIDVFSGISELLRENNHELYKKLQPFIDYHCILNMTSMAEIAVYSDRVFDKMKSRESISDQFDKAGLLNRVKLYIQEHIFEDILLENIANEVFISAPHLNRIFKKQMGETLLQYVTRQKMEKAAELLHDSKYKVYQVGDMLGYKTSRYFSKVFYNYMGCYPAQYRKNVLNIGEIGDEEK